jgi:hypothetical protein
VNVKVVPKQIFVVGTPLRVDSKFAPELLFTLIVIVASLGGQPVESSVAVNVIVKDPSDDQFTV